MTKYLFKQLRLRDCFMVNPYPSNLCHIRAKSPRFRSILLSQEEDFVRKSGIARRSLFSNALKGIANHVGYSSKLTHISEAYEQAKTLADLLKRWHLVQEVAQRSMSASSDFYPKRYIYDVGVLQRLRNMPFPDLSILLTLRASLRTQLGGILENAALLNIIPHRMGNSDISSWKKSAKEPFEVDFVWRTGNKLLPIECKATLKVSRRMFKNIEAYLDESGTNIGVLVSAAPFLEIRNKKQRLFNVPLYLCNPEFLMKLVEA